MKVNEEAVFTMLRELERQKFFGSLELKLEAGRVVLIKKTETFKPNDHRKKKKEEIALR